MPPGHQSEIRNKAVFPSSPKEGLNKMYGAMCLTQCKMRNAQ